MKTKTLNLTVKGINVPQEIMSRRFFPCDLRTCRHACCRFGAVLGTVNIAKIRRLLPELFPLMRPEAVETVKKRDFHRHTIFTRSDMSRDHDHYFLRTVKGACVFLAYDDRGGCVLQKYSLKRKMKTTLKPEGCRAFPFDLIGRRLALYDWKGLPCLDRSRTAKAPPMYITCKQELIGLLGEEGYKELRSKL